MTIRRKLYYSYGLKLAISVALFLVCFLAYEHEHNTRITATTALQEIQLLETLRGQMSLNRANLLSYVISGDPRDEAAANRGITGLGEMLRDAQNRAGDDQLRTTYAELNSEARTWAEEFAKPLMDKRRQVEGAPNAATEMRATYLLHSAADPMNKTTETLDEAERGLRRQFQSADASANTAAMICVIFLTCGSIVAALAGGLIAYRTSRSITEPIEQLTGVVRDLAETGDFDRTIDLRSDDETGALAEHYRNMMAHLREMAVVSASIASGQLNVNIHPRTTRDTMANAFLQMLHGLKELVTQVREGATQVAGGASQMAATSSESAKVSVDAAAAIDEVSSTMHEMSINVQNVVKSTQMQSSSVAETSASVDQMVASINRVADTSRTLLDICQRSREEVRTGIQTMEKTTDGLTRTNSAIQASAQIIDVLGHRADEIGKIIEVIDDLAEQTNLLALNAAIEAARAGEHGLGFAVVAEEVRKLAEKSTQSTKEISDLIQGIQKEAREAVENMEKSTGMVQEGLELGGELSSALGKISDVVSEVYRFAQQIGSATNEQSSGSAQIAKATTRLTEITQEINSTIEEQASGAQSVVRAMEKMRQLVQQSTSSSSQLAAAAEQMSKLSRGLLDSMDRFVVDEVAKKGPAGQRDARRKSAGMSDREASSLPAQRELARV